MTELMELLKQRQGKMSDEEYANKIGLRGSTLWRYYNGKSTIGTEALQKLATEFANKNDTIMLGALAAYALGLPSNAAKLEELGTHLLELKSVPSA